MGGASLAQSIGGSDVLFLGRVTSVERPSPPTHQNADGSVSVPGGSGPETSTLEILRVFRGAASASVQITSAGDNCDLGFRTGETWLVYGTLTTQGIETGKCARTRLLSRASPDIEFLEGRRRVAHRASCSAYCCGVPSGRAACS